MHDVLDNIEEKTINCLDHGFVTLIDVMPRLCDEGTTTADSAVAQAARVSYGKSTKTINEDRGLIRYLMRHSHTSPFEMIEFKFIQKLPIFTARQIVRHRTTSLNELSGRYSVLEDDFYIPNNDVRKQSQTNKQGGEEKVDNLTSNEFSNYLSDQAESVYKKYEYFIEKGISREQARMILPVNLYTKWVWKIDLHNLFHFLALRCDGHAQKEVREYGEAILKLITPIVPLCVEAWNDYHPMRGSIKLTKLEVEAIFSKFKNTSIGQINSDNSREKAEWVDKAKKLGFIVD